MKTIITEKYYNEDGKLIKEVITEKLETQDSVPAYPVYPIYPLYPSTPCPNKNWWEYPITIYTDYTVSIV